MTGALIRETEQFSANYNRRPYEFLHSLHENPLFEIPTLIGLSQRLPHNDNYWAAGKIKADDNWNVTAERQSLPDTIRDIHTNDSLVILKHVEQDPEFGPVLQAFLTEILRYSGPEMANDVIIGEVLIFITSPDRITSYHMDGETNFLVQIGGSKTAHVFDHTDESLVPQAKIEEYHIGNMSCLKFEPAFQTKAMTFRMAPGNAIHIPTFAPHWVQNDNNVSISLSVNYELKSVRDQASLVRFNHLLEKLGVKPQPVGHSAFGDRLKLATMSAAKATRDAIKPRPYGVWTPPRSGLQA